MNAQKSRRATALALLALVSVLLPACFTMPLHTTARTLPAGKVEFAAAPMLGARPDRTCARDCAAYLWTPMVGVAARYGLADGFELGARASFGVMLDGKLRLLDDERLAISVGASLGAASVLLVDPYPADFDLTILGELPLLFDLGPRDGLHVTGVVKWAVARRSVERSSALTGERISAQSYEHGPAAELGPSIPLGARITARPFAFLAARLVTEFGSWRSPWELTAAGGGLAVTWR